MAGRPRIEVLWWEGCPSTPEAIEDLRAALDEHGLDPEAIEVREIHTDADAERERFVGSPTIRVDGADVAEPDEREPVALACRVYHRRDGRISPTPDPADVRAAIAAAIDRRTRP